MVRNRSQGQEGLTDNRRGKQGDKLNNERTGRESLLHEDERSNKEKSKGVSRKGSPGKTNH